MWSFSVDRDQHDEVKLFFKVTVTATPSTSTAHLSAVLVDLGPATVRDYAHKAEGITTLANRTCWGSGTERDSACFKGTRARKKSVGHTVFSRGWADLGNHASGRKGVPLTLDLARTPVHVPLAGGVGAFARATRDGTSAAVSPSDRD